MDYIAAKEDGKKFLQQARTYSSRGSYTLALNAAVNASESFYEATLKAQGRDERNYVKKEFENAANLAEYLKSHIRKNQLKVSGTDARKSRMLSSPELQISEQNTQERPALESNGSAKGHVESSQSNVAYEAISHLPISERKVLLQSSKVNGQIFLPWSEKDEILVADADGEKYTDPAGHMHLGSGHLEFFDSWKRPNEIWLKDACMFGDKMWNLSQDVLSDCSIVAALCAVLFYEEKTGKKLVTNSIFPPMISDNGKYAFKIFFNGIHRRVIIDDFLPTSAKDRNIHVVCKSKSSILFPALIEKAYLKIFGGYEFPGSNAASDIFAFTSWIPEHILLHKDDLDSSALWTRMHHAWKHNDVILTVGTGKLSDAEQKSFGLVRDHDYAILDLKILDHGRKVVLIKNPWSHNRLNVNDTDDWRTDLTDALPSDSGTFWLDYASLLFRFDSLYLNWNPCIFKFRDQMHFRYKSNKVAPRVMINQPQYCIQNISSENATAWLVLSRHISQTTDEKMFIGINVYDTNGSAIYFKQPSLSNEALVDSQQTLLSISIPTGKSYTIVISCQRDSPSDNNFTLCTYSTARVQLSPVKQEFKYSVDAFGEWTEISAGGNVMSTNYCSNPQFKLAVSKKTKLQLFIFLEQELLVNIKIFWSDGKRIKRVLNRDVLADSGEYQVGCALIKPLTLDQGFYTIVPSVYESGTTGFFKIKLMSDEPCKITRLVDHLLE
ncbi:hypothetical protein V1511DRAFT_467375 [Dipodascopsis uninucleata]